MAYTKHTWEYGETFTPSKMNNIENGIETVENDCKYNVVARMTPNANETWRDFLTRFRTTYFNTLTTDQKRFGIIKMKCDGTSDILLYCDRFTGNNSANYSCKLPGGSNVRFLAIAFGTTIAVRRVAIGSSNTTFTDLSQEEAEGEIIWFAQNA